MILSALILITTLIVAVLNIYIWRANRHTAATLRELARLRDALGPVELVEQPWGTVVRKPVALNTGGGPHPTAPAPRPKRPHWLTEGER